MVPPNPQQFQRCWAEFHSQLESREAAGLPAATLAALGEGGGSEPRSRVGLQPAPELPGQAGGGRAPGVDGAQLSCEVEVAYADRSQDAVTLLSLGRQGESSEKPSPVSARLTLWVLAASNVGTSSIPARANAAVATARP